MQQLPADAAATTRAMPAAGTAATTCPPLRDAAMPTADTAPPAAQDTTVLRQSTLLAPTR